MSGIATSQGWTSQMVAGMDKVPVQNDTFLWNQLSLTSTTGDFSGQNKLPASFGKKKAALFKVNNEIKYLKRV